MAVDFVDSTGANLWPGDALTTGQGTGTLATLLETGDDSAPVNDQIGVNLTAGGQVLMPAPTATVTGRAGELVPLADQAQNGVVV